MLGSPQLPGPQFGFGQFESQGRLGQTPFVPTGTLSALSQACRQVRPIPALEAAGVDRAHWYAACSVRALADEHIMVALSSLRAGRARVTAG